MVQSVGESCGANLFENGPNKNLFDNGGLFVTDQKILNRLSLFVLASGVSQAVSISNRATGIIAFLVHLTKPCLDAQGGVFGFSFTLPVANVIEQLVCMTVQNLFALFDTDDADAVLDKPFDNERRFITSTPDSVKHKHEQDFETLLERVLAQLLQSISIFGWGFERRNAALLVFFDDPQPVFPRVFLTRLPLHGDIIMIGLSRCRNPV